MKRLYIISLLFISSICLSQTATPAPTATPVCIDRNCGNAIATVGYTSTFILGTITDVVEFTFVNTSNEWIYLGIREAAILGGGIPLAPNGGSYTIENGPLTNKWDWFIGPIYAISLSGNKTLAVTVR